MTPSFEVEMAKLATPITKPLRVGTPYIVRLPGLYGEHKTWLGTNTERKWMILGAVYELPLGWYESPWRRYFEKQSNGRRLAKIW